MQPTLPADSPSQREFHTLYSDHHGWLQGWLRKRIGSSCDAADLAQDTFIRLLTQGRESPLQLNEPRAYLATVANRLLINLYRRRSLEQTYLHTLASLPEHEVPSLEHQALMLEALNEVDAVLRTLPGKARSVFLLSQLEGYTYAEIALRLNMKLRTVQRYMALAIEECIMLSMSHAL